jgi:hypothetical protein
MTMYDSGCKCTKKDMSNQVTLGHPYGSSRSPEISTELFCTGEKIGCSTLAQHDGRGGEFCAERYETDSNGNWKADCSANTSDDGTISCEPLLTTEKSPNTYPVTCSDLSTPEPQKCNTGYDISPSGGGNAYQCYADDAEQCKTSTTSCTPPDTS